MPKAPASAAATGLRKPMTEAEKQKFLLMLGQNYRQLEYSIPDLRSASVILEAVIEDALNNPEEVGDMKRFDMTGDQWDALTYAARHLGDLARDLSKTYYRGYEAPLEVSAAS